MSETGVKSDPAFCLGPTIMKTNSGRESLNIHKRTLETSSYNSIECTIIFNNLSYRFNWKNEKDMTLLQQCCSIKIKTLDEFRRHFIALLS